MVKHLLRPHIDKLAKLEGRPHSHAQGTGNARVCARDVQIDYAL